MDTALRFWGRLALVLGLALWLAPAFAGTPARAWIVQENESIVDAGAADLPLPPASLTKIMTALLWVQEPQRQEQWVTVSRRAAAAGGSRIGLQAGKRYRGADLLAAMLIVSANDACMALAEHAAGSIEQFVADMNRAAEALDLFRTHFKNPCGLDAPGHTSSARDLLRLSEMALSEPIFRDVVGRAHWPWPDPDSGRIVRVLQSSNQLFGRVEGLRGVKTGFTGGAGKCLIALVERAGRRVLLVLLNAEDRWQVAPRMIEAALRRPLP